MYLLGGKGASCLSHASPDNFCCLLTSQFRLWLVPHPEHQQSVFHKNKNVGKEVSSNFKYLQTPSSLSKSKECVQKEQKVLEATFSQCGYKSLIN